MSIPSQEGLSADKISKIQRDLDIVRNNMTVFSEILTELNPSGPGSGGNEDLELLRELYKTCKEMQSRVGQLLCTPTTDELTVDMLQINDDLNDLFDRYDRKTAGYRGVGEAPLIDLGDDGGGGGVAAAIGKINLQKEPDDFDQFVSSRSSEAKGATENKKSATHGLGEDDIIRGHRETDFEEMEAWLKANPGSEALSPPSGNYGRANPHQQQKQQKYDPSYNPSC